MDGGDGLPGPRVALTFDDGPDDVFTPRVLDTLADLGVSAAFFCVGRQVVRHPDVVRRLAAADHVVGNHSWSHRPLTRLDEGARVAEIERTTDALAAVIAKRPAYLRPPYGAVDAAVQETVRRLDYEMVLWHVDSRDWSGLPGADVLRRVLDGVAADAIILHHSAGRVAGGVQALAEEIREGRRRGWRFVRLDTLCARAPYQM